MSRETSSYRFFFLLFNFYPDRMIARKNFIIFLLMLSPFTAHQKKRTFYGSRLIKYFADNPHDI